MYLINFIVALGAIMLQAVTALPCKFTDWRITGYNDDRCTKPNKTLTNIAQAKWFHNQVIGKVGIGQVPMSNECEFVPKDFFGMEGLTDYLQFNESVQATINQFYNSKYSAQWECSPESALFRVYSDSNFWTKLTKNKALNWASKVNDELFKQCREGNERAQYPHCLPCIGGPNSQWKHPYYDYDETCQTNCTTKNFEYPLCLTKKDPTHPWFKIADPFGYDITYVYKFDKNKDGKLNQAELLGGLTNIMQGKDYYKTKQRLVNYLDEIKSKDGKLDVRAVGYVIVKLLYNLQVTYQDYVNADPYTKEKIENMLRTNNTRWNPAITTQGCSADGSNPWYKYNQNCQCIQDQSDSKKIPAYPHCLKCDESHPFFRLDSVSCYKGLSGIQILYQDKVSQLTTKGLIDGQKDLKYQYLIKLYIELFSWNIQMYYSADTQMTDAYKAHIELIERVEQMTKEQFEEYKQELEQKRRRLKQSEQETDTDVKQPVFQEVEQELQQARQLEDASSSSSKSSMKKESSDGHQYTITEKTEGVALAEDYPKKSGYTATYELMHHQPTYGAYCEEARQYLEKGWLELKPNDYCYNHFHNNFEPYNEQDLCDSQQIHLEMWKSPDFWTDPCQDCYCYWQNCFIAPFNISCPQRIYGTENPPYTNQTSRGPTTVEIDLDAKVLDYFDLTNDELLRGIKTKLEQIHNNWNKFTVFDTEPNCGIVNPLLEPLIQIDWDKCFEDEGKYYKIIGSVFLVSSMFTTAGTLLFSLLT